MLTTRSLMRNSRTGRRWMTVMAAVGVVVAMTAPAGAAATVSDPPTWPSNPNWQSLVPAPSSGDVRPVSILRRTGTYDVYQVGAGTFEFSSTS